MSDNKTPIRSIRIPQDLWDAVKDKLKQETLQQEPSASDLARAAFIAYVQGDLNLHMVYGEYRIEVPKTD